MVSVSFACSIEQSSNRAVNEGISDSIDIIHNEIHLSMDIEAHHMVSKSVVNFDVLIEGIERFKIDLMGFTVDSVLYNGSNIAFEDDGYKILLNFGSVLAKGNHEVVLHYSGESLRDPVESSSGAGWGGVWWTEKIAFNVGVAFKDSSHSYGRTLMPCFDNFIEKSTYEFYITTKKTERSSAPGLLIDTVSTDSTIIWHWESLNPISSYLVGIAVGDFEMIERSYVGIKKTIPIQLFANKSDTSYLENAFKNLDQMIALFEDKFGPYPFEKIGYSILPFSGGAMEHAGNIAYPASMVRSASSYDEGVIAHELSHMWFGNALTTSKPEAMYLNEGFAAFATLLFKEDVYGRDAYIETVHSERNYVIKNAHLNDGAYLALDNVPNESTYGTHTYTKGAQMLHSLRSYVNNDLAFFECLESYVTKYTHDVVNTDSLQNHLSNCLGYDMAFFFDPWVRNAGFVDLAIRSNAVKAHGDGTYQIRTKVDQQLTHSTALYKNIPITISYFDAAWNETTTRFVLEDGCNEFEKTLSFSPVYVALNWDEIVSDGVLRDYEVIDSKGSKNYSDELFKFKVDEITDSCLIRAELHLVQPQLTTLPTGVYLSNSKYWRVEGIKTNAVSGYFQFSFDGRETGPNALMDTDWLVADDEKVVLLYRVDGNAAWALVTDGELAAGSITDKRGDLKTYDLRFGEYAMGIKMAHNLLLDKYLDHSTCSLLLINEMNLGDDLHVYPNPIEGNHLMISMKEKIDRVELYDIQGRILLNVGGNQQNELAITLPEAIKGNLLLKVLTESNTYQSTLVQKL